MLFSTEDNKNKFNLLDKINLNNEDEDANILGDLIEEDNVENMDELNNDELDIIE